LLFPYLAATEGQNISSVSSASVAASSEIISWRTDVPADSQAE
jgi:hypothetical protein